MKKIILACISVAIICLATLNINKSINMDNQTSLAKLLTVNIANAELGDPYRHWRCAATGSAYDQCWVQMIPVYGCVSSTIPYPSC